MKKILSMAVLALAVTVLSQQQASAWINLKAGVGANLGFQSGGNCLLWGAFRNGQPPAPGVGCPAPAPIPAPHGPHGPHAAPYAPAFAAPAQTQSYRAPVYQTGNARYVPYGYGR